MHDEHRVRDHQAREMAEGNLHTLVNTLTEGLRDLPTDYATRVKHFLAEYLGSSRHPVPFGGRTRDFAHLDDWLADQDAPPTCSWPRLRVVVNPPCSCAGVKGYSPSLTPPSSTSR